MTGGTEPDCDPLEWIADPDLACSGATVPRLRTLVPRAADSCPDCAFPAGPAGSPTFTTSPTTGPPLLPHPPRWLPHRHRHQRQQRQTGQEGPLTGRFVATPVHETEADHDHDHDRQPPHHAYEHSGHRINLGTFSRNHRPTTSSGTVLG
ncbi:hypothetical protein [Streptomyces kasugaensis]|uniref:hypothetical protein n=1 Tax=Streptomyces kasugaensis TaxID=1946 RepID=UPI0013EF7747|nr:hypothetical protein [Streptomyces kasugaensis]